MNQPLIALVVTLGWWLVPACLTLFAVFLMISVRPEDSSDIGGWLMSFMLLAAILLVWLVYFALCYLLS